MARLQKNNQRHFFHIHHSCYLQSYTTIKPTKYFNEVSISPKVEVHISEVSMNVITIPATNSGEFMMHNNIRNSAAVHSITYDSYFRLQSVITALILQLSFTVLVLNILTYLVFQVFYCAVLYKINNKNPAIN